MFPGERPTGPFRPPSACADEAARTGRSGEGGPSRVLGVSTTHSLEDPMSVTTHQPLNGVDVPTLFATLDAVKAQNDIAAFQFRASNTWVGGTHSRTTYSGFFVAGQEMQHEHETVVEADHPAVLVGNDHAPTAAEYLLHAIAACLTSRIPNIAAVRRVELTKVTSTAAGDIDL